MNAAAVKGQQGIPENVGMLELTPWSFWCAGHAPFVWFGAAGGTTVISVPGIDASGVLPFQRSGSAFDDAG